MNNLQGDIYFHVGNKQVIKFAVSFSDILAKSLQNLTFVSSKIRDFIMFENLSDKLDRAFKVLKGQGSITEINVAETMKEIRKALLDADVNYKTAKSFTDDVRTKALGENVLTSISPGQLLTKIMSDEL